MKNPYAASVTRDSDVAPSEWPVTTLSALNDAVKRIPVEEIDSLDDTVNLAVESLCLGRAYLFQAKLRLKRAIRLNAKNPKVVLRLGSLIGDLEQVEKRFPLTIKNDGKRAERDPDEPHDKLPQAVPDALPVAQ